MMYHFTVGVILYLMLSPNSFKSPNAHYVVGFIYTLLFFKELLKNL